MTNNRSTLKNCLFIYSKIWKISKSRIIIPIFISALGSLCTVSIMLFPKLIIDSIINEESILSTILIILSRIGLTLFYNILFRIFSEKIFPLEELKINEYFTTNLYRKSKKIDLKNFDTPEFYDKYSRTISKSQELPGKFLNLYSSFLNFIFDTIALITTLTYISPFTIIIVIISFAFNTWINSFISKKDYKFEVNTTREKRIFEYIKRIFYIPQYKNDLLFFNLNITALKKYDEANSILVKKILRYKPFRAIIYSTSNLIFNVINLGIGGCYLGINVIIGHVTIGKLVSGLYAMEELGNVFSMAGSIIPKYKQLSLFINDYRDIMENYSELYKNTGIDFSNQKILKISFKNVSFGYQTGINIIKNLNVTIKNGSKIALVGKNGAGKSTFLKLLLKLYNPTSGNIYINETDLSKINTSSFYKLCSPMFQDTNCYALSINENIKIASSHSSSNEKNIDYAFEKSGISEKISTLPKKSDTLMFSEIHKDGIDFSGGEIQKIGIARIIYRNTDLIVMDEPTAALDPISEKKFYDTIDSLSKEKILIIVSHRLSSVKKMDRILFFENGMIIEDGSHSELIKKNGKYAKMFKTQSKRYGDNDECE